jgi:hypothetical protein
MLDGQNTIEQQEVAAAFEQVRENTTGFEKAAARLDEFFESLDEDCDQIIDD